MESIKKRNYGFDWLKGVACIAVVLIHYNLPDQAGIIMKRYADLPSLYFLWCPVSLLFLVMECLFKR